MFSEMKTFFIYLLTSIKSSISLRESFFLQSVLMLISNFFFFSFWWIYFNRFHSIKEWTLSDMACLYGIVNGAFGFFSVFFGGARYLARMIIEGDLDALIVKPKGLLMQVVATRSVPSGWGDMVSAIFFLGLSGYMSVTIFPLILLFIVTSSFIMLAFAIILDSIAFWFGNTHAISKQIFEFLLTFSNYPKAIYTGMLKFFLLTLIPAGFISFLPIDVIREFSVIAMGEIVLFALFYLWIAKKIFYLGLRRYSSGNKSGFKV